MQNLAFLYTSSLVAQYLGRQGAPRGKGSANNQRETHRRSDPAPSKQRDGINGVRSCSLNRDDAYRNNEDDGFNSRTNDNAPQCLETTNERSVLIIKIFFLDLSSPVKRGRST